MNFPEALVLAMTTEESMNATLIMKDVSLPQKYLEFKEMFCFISKIDPKQPLKDLVIKLNLQDYKDIIKFTEFFDNLVQQENADEIFNETIPTFLKYIAIFWYMFEYNKEKDSLIGQLEYIPKIIDIFNQKYNIFEGDDEKIKQKYSLDVLISHLLKAIINYYTSNETKDKKVFESIKAILESITKNIPEDKVKDDSFIDFLVEKLSHFEGEEKREILYYILKIFILACKKYPEFSNKFDIQPFYIMSNVFNSVKDLKITQKDVDYIMDINSDTNQTIFNNSVLFLLIKLLKKNNLLLEFCTKYNTYKEVKSNTIMLYRAGIIPVLLAAITGTEDNESTVYYYKWLSYIGLYSFYKKDIRKLFKAILNSSKTSKIVESLIQIINLNLFSDHFDENDPERRKIMDTFKLMGGPLIFVPLFLKKKDADVEYFSSLINLLYAMAKIDSGLFSGVQFPLILSEILNRTMKNVFPDKEHSIALVTNLANLFKSIDESKEMWDNMVVNFSVNKYMPEFIPVFFQNIKIYFRDVDYNDLLMRIYNGYQNEPGNEELENTLYEFLITLCDKSKQSKAITPTNVLYFASNNIDNVMSDVCLRVATLMQSNSEKEKKSDFYDAVVQMNFKPFIYLLKSSNIEKIKSTIRLLSLTIYGMENYEIDGKNKYNIDDIKKKIYKLAAYIGDLSGNHDLVEFMMKEITYNPVKRESFTNVTYQEYLPFMCHLIKVMNEEDLNNLFNYLAKNGITLISNIYYVCIIFIMYVTNDYLKWSEALLPNGFKNIDITTLLRSINFFASLEGKTNKEYVELLNKTLKLILEKEWINKDNVALLMFFCNHRIDFELTHSDESVNFSSFIKIAETTFRNEKCKVVDIEISDFTDDYKQTLAKFIKILSENEYSILGNNNHSFSLYSDILSTLLLFNEETYNKAAQNELNTLFKLVNHGRSDKALKNEAIIITSHLFNTVKENELSGTIMKLTLDVQNVNDTKKNDIFNKSVENVVKIIKNADKQSYDEITWVPDEEDQSTIEITNQYNKICDEQLKKTETSAYILKLLEEKLYNSVCGIWKSDSAKEMVQDSTTDLFGRHWRLKPKKSIEGKVPLPSFVKNRERIMNDQTERLAWFKATLFTIKNKYYGGMFITDKQILFSGISTRDKTTKKELIIDLDSIVDVLKIKKNCEIYTNKSKYISFSVHNKIKEIIPAYGKEIRKKVPDLVTAWQEKKLNNYQFLFKINLIAGRSYNNLDKYIIFPQVLNCYNETEIDLSVESIYRNLETDLGIPSKNVVTSYLSKCVAFHEKVQNPLQSIIEEYAKNNELIPEFFSNSNILKGVELPQWAKNPAHFILMNRLALESEYVSNNLLKWVKRFFKCFDINVSIRKSKSFVQNGLIIKKIEEGISKSIDPNVKYDDDCDCINIITHDNFLYIAKKGSSVKVIELNGGKKKKFELSKYGTLDCIKSAKNTLIFFDKKYIISCAPNEESCTLVVDENVTSQIPLKMYPISSISGRDSNSFVTCHKDSTVFVWKDIKENKYDRINAHNEIVIFAQSSKALNSVVTVDKKGILIVSSYNECQPYSSTSFDSVPLNMLLTKMGLIVVLLKDNDGFFVEVMDLMCNVIHKKKFDINYATTCIAHGSNCVEYIIICGRESTKVIRLYDMKVVKEISHEYYPAAVTYNEMYKCIIIAEKSGNCHFYILENA